MITPEQEAFLASVTLDQPWSRIERCTTLKRERPDDVRTVANEIALRLERLGIPCQIHEPKLYLRLP